MFADQAYFNIALAGGFLIVLLFLRQLLINKKAFISKLFAIPITKGDGAIEVESVKKITSAASVAIINVDGERMLVGIGESSVTKLKDLKGNTENEE
ncbi:flagellar biosynthetic protein FliO [Photobacterium leiognathi]|uniref:flagellar biosynthetic protein FliO n=1 Tax=Photobacterium leiognathi TaxID=553611 RepID=UPI001EDD2733|nr:flagellar biosynthetic protein FliO [Photobacterium leiognathi]MCG3883689.1 flagellar biosynthetic protein FliO [Photobacterium leiognathi]